MPVGLRNDSTDQDVPPHIIPTSFGGADFEIFLALDPYDS